VYPVQNKESGKEQTANMNHLGSSIYEMGLKSKNYILKHDLLPNSPKISSDHM
jgi:hypothetical protein